MRYLWLFWCLLSGLVVGAQSPIIDTCSGSGIQSSLPGFAAEGLILTAFDGASLWVYDIARSTRYPLPQTRPCIANCHLSPDNRWLAYFDPEREVFARMRLDGTQRSDLVANASDVLWWQPDTLLIWTTDHRAYLRPESDPANPGEYLPVDNIRSIQPGGRWGLAVAYEQDAFYRYLINLDTRGTADEQRLRLAVDTPYFNAAAWSPDGSRLAYVGKGAVDSQSGVAGAELFVAMPGSGIPQQMTFLSADYGAVRINGYAPADISWSPDSRYIAFWVVDLTGPDPEANTGNAILHVLDSSTGSLRRYCDFSTIEHTPLTPEIIWSPDGAYLTFAGNVPGDDKGVLLLIVDVNNGSILELSDGIFPAWGTAQVYAWGLLP